MGIRNFLKREKKESFEGSGLVLFTNVKRAIIADRVLKDAGYASRLVAPPIELRKGCDLAVEIYLVEQLGIERLLKEKNVDYFKVAPLKIETSELPEIFKTIDFGRYLMVVVGNLKLSFDKERGIIVNISGGGCPDVPYIAIELIGKKITEAKRPRDIGFSLCALMLDMALDKSIVIWKGF